MGRRLLRKHSSRLLLLFSFITVASQTALAQSPSDWGIDAGTARIAIGQVLADWALRMDEGDIVSATDLFSPTAKLALFYNDTSSGKQIIAPTGRAPNRNGDGGKSGGGCSVHGRKAIIGFFRGRGPSFGPVEPTTLPTSAARIWVYNTAVKLTPGNNAAEAVSYMARSVTRLDPFAGLLVTQMKKDSNHGWEIVEMKMIFNLDQPNYPCTAQSGG